MTFRLPFTNVAPKGTVQLLTGAAAASNTLDAPTSVVPSNQTVATGMTFNWTAPGYSVAVLTVEAS